MVDSGAHVPAGPALADVAAAQRQVHEAQDTLRLSVERARDGGHTWQEIGDVLGTSRQAAFQRFGRPVDPRTGRPMGEAIVEGAAEHAIGLLLAASAMLHDPGRAFDQNTATAEAITLVRGAIQLASQPS
jgi:hypothetical protein